MKIAVYPGSFDPITCGHVDIIERAAQLYDQLVVTVFPNVSKNGRFSHEDRVEMIEESIKHLTNVSVERFDGLLVDFAKAKKAQVIVKGLRAVSDFDYEFKMALMNKKLAPGIETVFIMTSSRHLYLSSSLVKEVYGYGACIEGLVPPPVIKKWKTLEDCQK